MRRLATGLLGVMLLVFVACTLMARRHPWLGYPGAFAEAGLVGGCADWFAVVALFRRPFGLPIPHTAILPRNKERLADQLGAFIAGAFLAPAEIEPRLEKLDLAGWMAAWLKDDANLGLVVECAQALMQPALEMAADDELRRFGQGMIRNGIDSVAAAPMAGRVLATVVAGGYADMAYERGITWAITALRENRATIRAKAAEQSSGWLPRWIDSKAADSFINGFLKTLDAALEPEHPWRARFAEFLERTIDKLTNDPITHRQWEDIKSEVLDAQFVDDFIDWLANQAELRLKAELEDRSGVLTQTLHRGPAAVGTWLEKDQSVRDLINRWSRNVVLGAIVPNRVEIGAFVTDVVNRWDATTMTERLERYVGRDLQYIRINGTLVGGLVGLVLFSLTKLLLR